MAFPLPVLGIKINICQNTGMFKNPTNEGPGCTQYLPSMQGALGLSSSTAYARLHGACLQSSTEEVEAGGSEAQHPPIHGEFEDSLCQRDCLKIGITNTRGMEWVEAGRTKPGELYNGYF